MKAAARAAGILAAYFLLAIVATLPLATQATDHVVCDASAESGACIGTPVLNAWAMGWVLRQLPRDPLHLFDANIFFPYGDTLAYSEHLLGPALLAAPFLGLTGNLVLAYNLVSLLTLALAGFGMWLLARELVGDSHAAFAAGVVYAFHSFNLNELVRIQTLSNQWFPLLLLALLRYFARPGWGWAWAAALAYAAQSLSGMYWALYAPALVAATVLFLAWRVRTPAHAWVPLAVTFLPAMLLVACFFLPYLRLAHEFGFAREEPAAVPLELYLRTPPNSLLYAGILGTAGPNELAPHFLGFAAMALAVLGLFRAAAPSRALRIALLVMASFGLAVSLGPRIEVGGTSFPGPYALLRAVVPGFENVRYPERLSQFLVLAIAPLVAAGMGVLRRRLGVAGLTAISGLVFLECLALPMKQAPLPPPERLPSVYRWVAGVRDARVVAEVPTVYYTSDRPDALPMWASLAHGKRTVQAHSGYFPPTYALIKWRLFHFPSDDSVDFLSRFGVDTVIVHPGAAGRPPEWAGPDPRWSVVGPFAEGHVALTLQRGVPFAPPTRNDRLVEVERDGWSLRSEPTGASRVLDSDTTTAWAFGPRPGESWIAVSFGRSIRVARVSLLLRPRAWRFPARLKLLGRTPGESGLHPLSYDARAAYDSLASSLLFEPLRARLCIDLETTPLDAIELRGNSDAFRLPAEVAELRVHSPG